MRAVFLFQEDKMKRVRCISRKVNGMLHVAVPQLFLDPFTDGEERDVDDDAADNLLGRNGYSGSPCFEEVLSPTNTDVKPAFKADAKRDGGNA